MMDGIWQWGLVVITTLQSAQGPALEAVFRAVSFLGDEQFYLLLFPTLLWCVDARLGFRLGVLFLISVYLNSLIKDVVGYPRPRAMGVLAGVATGFAVSIRYLRVTAEGPWWQRGLRLLVGLAILLALYVGLRIVVPGGEAPLHLVFRFARYAVLGLWISLGAPWVFSKLSLSRHFAPRPAVVGAG